MPQDEVTFSPFSREFFGNITRTCHIANKTASFRKFLEILCHQIRNQLLVFSTEQEEKKSIRLTVGFTFYFEVCKPFPLSVWKPNWITQDFKNLILDSLHGITRIHTFIVPNKKIIFLTNGMMQLVVFWQCSWWLMLWAVSVCVFLYVYMHVCMCVCIYVFKDTYTHSHTSYVYKYYKQPERYHETPKRTTRASLRHTLTYIYTYTHTHTHTHTYSHTHTHTHAYTHTHTHTHAHTSYTYTHEKQRHQTPKRSNRANLRHTLKYINTHIHAWHDSFVSVT